MLVCERRLSDFVPHRILGYHGAEYITDMSRYIVRTQADTEKTQTIGLEIEISRNKPITSAMLEKMVEICPYLQFSSDGSIPGDYTMEIQTAPMTLNAIKESGLKELFEYFIRHDIKASAVTNFDTGEGCGGHIHISKGDKWEDVVTLMAMFIDQNKEIVQLICRRPFTTYAYNNLRGMGKSIRRFSTEEVKKELRANSMSHSATLNLQHSATIEFRLPIGTVNFNTKMAHIEFITNLYKCCEDVVNGKARIDRLTINKICQDGDYLPGYMSDLGLSCSKKLRIMDGELKKRIKQVEEDKNKVVRILNTLQRELATTCDNEIRQGSIRTISNRFNDITQAPTIDNALVVIRGMQNADTISDGLETYSETHNNNITKHYAELRALINAMDTKDIYYNLSEEI